MKEYKINLTVFIAGILFCIFPLTGCGSAESGGKAEEETFYYVPAYTELHDQGAVGDIYLCDSKLFYTVYEDADGRYVKGESYQKDLQSEGTPESWELQFPESSLGLVTLFTDPEENYGTIEWDLHAGAQKEDSYSAGYCLSKYDAAGSLLSRQDITAFLEEGEKGGRIVQKAVTDAEGNVYIVGYRTILLLNAAGEYQGTLVEEKGISDISSDREGKVYYLVALEKELKTVDFINAQGRTVVRDLLSGNGMCWDEENRLLTYDGDGIYRYDRDTSEQELLLDWLDVDILGSEILGMTVLEDGRIIVLGEGDEEETDREESSFYHNSLELISLSRKKGQQIQQKEVITLGVMTVNDSMRRAAVAFNRSSDQYTVRIKEYLKENSEQGYEDAILSLDLDMVSGEMPDIIDVGSLDLQKYISKGLLEDLYPYLEASEKLQKEDLVESIVDACTFEEKLVCLPAGFRLQLILGRSSQLGSKEGWTLEEMIAFFEQYQDEQVYASLSKEGMLELCLTLYQPTAVNLPEGDSSSQADTLRTILMFADCFTGETAGWQYIQQQDGSNLLKKIWFTGPEYVSEMPQYFEGEAVTYIGYPAADGTSGILLDTSMNAFGILKDSPCREGAWEFLEYLILEACFTENGQYAQFPILKETLEKQIEAAAAEPYERDEAGEILLDAEGNPVRRVITSNHFLGSGQVTQVYALLPEEEAVIRELIQKARPTTANHEQITEIILEEAGAYFAGQKSVEEVITVMQNRINIYVSENQQNGKRSR